MSTVAKALTQTSCPACEYERGLKGRARQSGYEMRCMDCGTTWREFGDRPANAENSNNSDAAKDEDRKQIRPDWSNVVEHKETVPGYSMRLGNHSAIYMTGIAGIAFLFCLAASVFIFQSLTQKRIDKITTASVAKSGLSIESIKLQERVRPEGKKVFTVHGWLVNPTASGKPVPRIAIILRSENGGEIVRWYYKPPVTMLEEGRKLRFSSSVSYDTPFTTYAEARFE